MIELLGPFAVVAAALAVGGALKLADPGPTAAMLGALGLPRSATLARASGVVEVAVGVAAVLVGGTVLAGAVAALFALFTAMNVQLVRLGDHAASCGCFGRLSSPPTAVHVAADAAAAAVAVAAALTAVPGWVAAWGELPLAGLPFLALVALGTWAFVATLTALPDALVAARRGPADRGPATFHLTGAPLAPATAPADRGRRRGRAGPGGT